MKISKLNKKVQQQLFNYGELYVFYLLKTRNNEEKICFGDENRTLYVEWMWSEDQDGTRHHDVILSEEDLNGNEEHFTPYDSIEELSSLDGILIERDFLRSIILALNYDREEPLMALSKSQAKKIFGIM